MTQGPNPGWLGLKTAPFWGLRVHAHCPLSFLPVRRWGYTFQFLETMNPVKNDYTFAKRARVPRTIFNVVRLTSILFLTAVWSVRARKSWGGEKNNHNSYSLPYWYLWTFALNLIWRRYVISNFAIFKHKLIMQWNSKFRQVF